MKLKCPFPHDKSPVFLGQGFMDLLVRQGSISELWLRGGLASWAWDSLSPTLAAPRLSGGGLLSPATIPPASVSGSGRSGCPGETARHLPPLLCGSWGGQGPAGWAPLSGK